ncbi:periplasmic heavy metal sensor [Primorskyibacter sp. S187A]|uniref:periplasmic heavy metal sensor n=1 Tax=Primorskyibacter sp. S187A TaxID=3415130 RepID=UPI003C7DC147
MSDTDQKQPRSGRVLRVLLFVSLAGNLVVLGLVVGAVLKGGPHDGPRNLARDTVAPFTRALAREDRRSIGRDIRQTVAGGDAAAWRAARQQRYTEALRLLREESFDADAFGAVLAGQVAQVQAVAGAGSVALTRHIAGMSASERQSYADRVEEELRRGKKDRKGKP